ncbi:hypothetical protein DFH07DRAFT_781835 [Mycena maculata]|uniref:Uncharacterized protein n=1 Tax=Mycena maculata TaxID=230809 RepID=A0AAD7HWE0_9AGAR|nr:hypothetical protein DFH07DRAFT_781835 [Mycena maculata]
MWDHYLRWCAMGRRGDGHDGKKNKWTFGTLEGCGCTGAVEGKTDVPETKTETEEGRELGAWVYELHALVAFLDVEDAVCAWMVLSVEEGLYAGARRWFVEEPWPEALGLSYKGEALGGDRSVQTLSVREPPGSCTRACVIPRPERRIPVIVYSRTAPPMEPRGMSPRGSRATPPMDE